jgi:hypothetical protein
MKEEVTQLKDLKDELHALKATSNLYTNVDDPVESEDNTALSLLLSLTDLYLATPLKSYLS